MVEFVKEIIDECFDDFSMNLKSLLRFELKNSYTKNSIHHKISVFWGVGALGFRVLGVLGFGIEKDPFFN